MGALSHPNLAPEHEALQAQVIENLRTIFDPEISVNIYDLGLIYAIHIRENGFVDIDMTLTSPACPVAHTLPGQVEQCVQNIPNITGAKVELVWEPPWSPECLTDEVKLQLGLL